MTESEMLQKLFAVKRILKILADNLTCDYMLASDALDDLNPVIDHLWLNETGQLVSSSDDR